VRVYVYHDHVSGAACSTQHLEVLKRGGGGQGPGGAGGA